MSAVIDDVMARLGCCGLSVRFAMQAFRLPVPSDLALGTVVQPSG